MIPKYGFDQRHHPDSLHWMLACVALLLSLAIHLAMVFFCSELRIGAMPRFRERWRTRFEGGRVPPMRVERVMRADPMQLGRKVRGERDTPSRGPIEVSERVESLSEKESLTLTTPPLVPREALAPGVIALKDALSEQVDTTPWLPRQEIAQIFDRAVQDELALLPRRELPMIERVAAAPDIVPSIELTGRQFGKEIAPPKPFEAAELFDTEISKGTFQVKPAEIPETTPSIKAGATEERFGLKPGERDEQQRQTLESAREQLKKALDKATSEGRLTRDGRKAVETQATISELQETIEYLPIDDLLAVGLETYRDPSETELTYFRIGIQPRSDKTLPVLPKDILFLQDVSASMSEARMVYCRRGLATALEGLNPGDRFNVAAFRDTFETFSPVWVEANAANLDKATTFVDRMRAFGQTDVFGSLQALLKMPRDPNRPMIAVIVTDGIPTFGIVESAPIIGQFSNLNNGMISIYMIGTVKRANMFLLDMLSYCNRGTTLVLQGNRWDLPDTMARVFEGVRHPVMADTSVTFDTTSQCEVYPVNASNLYKNRQLELCGTCAASTKELIFQIRGLADGKGYDSIFRLDMERHAQAGKPTIRTRWALHKMYHLIGVHTLDPSPDIMETMRRINKQYGIAIPYADQLQQ